MDRDDQKASGLYRDGNSFLHQLDSRVKLVLLFLLTICLFASSDPMQLLLLSGICATCLGLGRISFVFVLKKLLVLRWLLLLTLVIHLFFTPGRTLFGFSWLSYDGLLRGMTVDLQLSLALFFSYLLALTTSPTALASGLSRLLSPLKRFGFPVYESGGLLLLVLHFIPMVRSEAVVLHHPKTCISFFERIRSSVELIGPLLLRLVDRADLLASQIVIEEKSLTEGDADQDGQLGRTDLWTFVVTLSVLTLIWLL